MRVRSWLIALAGTACAIAIPAWAQTAGMPAVLLMMTGFTRIVIVLSLMRQALGTPASPPNQVLIGLSLCLTFFVMSPVLDRIYSDAYKPFSENRITMEQALDSGAVPLRTFMLRQTREADLSLFVKLSNEA